MASRTTPGHGLNLDGRCLPHPRRRRLRHPFNRLSDSRRPPRRSIEVIAEIVGVQEASPEAAANEHADVN
jgi:hypothetical protein